MDANKFDGLARLLFRIGSRRALIGALLAGATGKTTQEVTEAAKRRGRKGRKKGRGGKGNGGGHTPLCVCHKDDHVVCPDDDGVFEGHKKHGDCVCEGQEGGEKGCQCDTLKNNASCTGRCDKAGTPCTGQGDNCCEDLSCAITTPGGGKVCCLTNGKPASRAKLCCTGYRNPTTGKCDNPPVCRDSDCRGPGQCGCNAAGTACKTNCPVTCSTNPCTKNSECGEGCECKLTVAESYQTCYDQSGYVTECPPAKGVCRKVVCEVHRGDPCETDADCCGEYPICTGVHCPLYKSKCETANYCGTPEA